MAYLGQGPFQEFTNPPTKDSFTGDGSTTTFDMNATVSSSAQNALEVYVDNVRQEPGVGKAFTLGPDGSNDMKRITFSAAPANGASIYVINDKTNVSVTAPLQNDLNGTELILDGDGDTSITADSDDRIDFKIGGIDHFHITSSSSDTVIQNKVDAKDFKFNQYDGRTILEVNDAGYVALANGATGSGELRIYEDTDNGTNYTGFKVGAQSADIDYVLPTADGSSGQFLKTDGSGNLSFATAGAITSYTNSTNNRIVTSVDSSTVNGEANLTFDGSALQVTGTLTVGADDTGHDVIFYGATASANMTWDESADDLILSGVARMVIPEGQLVLGSTQVMATAAELNKLDGATVTVSEINIIDGDTSATSTTVADADRVVMNDNGTMVQVAVTDLAAYFDDEITAMPNLTSVGTLTALTVDDVAVNGKVITMTGSSSDTATLTAGTNGTLDIVTTDAGGAAANIQITADGTAELAGTTVTLDSSGGITLDADGGTITFADGGSSLGTITSSGYSGTAAVATTVTVTDNESTNENNVLTFVAGADADGGNVGLESDGNLTYNPSTGTLTTTNIVVSGTQTITNSVTMNANNAVVFEGATADAHETTLSTVDATGDRTINLPNVSGTLPVLAAASATQITSTPEELNLLDGSSANTVVNSKAVIYGSSGELAGTLSTAAQTNITSLGNLTALTLAGDIANASGNMTIASQEILTLDAAGDIILDADGGDILFKDGGTGVLYFGIANSSATLMTQVSDADFVIKGNDGGSTITALTLDMSAAGAATFNGAITGGGLLTTGGNIVIPDTGNIGSASDTDAISIAANGETSFNTGIKLADSKKIKLGSGEDLEIYHDGNNSLISEVGTGNLDITSNGANVSIMGKAGENSIVATGDGSVELYYDNTKKLETGSAGVDISNGSLRVIDGSFALRSGSSNGGSFVMHKDVTGSGSDLAPCIFAESGEPIHFMVNGSATTEMLLETDGDLHVDGDVIAFSTTTSDERLKKDIQPIEDALSKVSQLNGVTFTYKIDGKESAGLIAQDVEKVLPSAVSEKELILKENDGEKYKVLQYDQTIGLLVEAIKELTAKVEELEKK